MPPAVLGFLLAAAVAVPSNAQGERRLLPAKAFLPILYAGPREPTTAAKLILVSDHASRLDKLIEAEAAVGTTLPLLILAGSTPNDALVIGIQGGVFARFTMQTAERDLISSDWIIAVPVVWHRGRHWLRLRYFHQSSHLGDEYIERFDVERIAYGRDEIGLLGSYALTNAWSVYGGGRAGFRVEPPGTGRWTVRAGTQVDGPALTDAIDLYAAGDAELTNAEQWTPRLNLHAGVRIRSIHDRTARIAVEILSGPSPQGQFLGERTFFTTLGVYFDL